MNLKCEYKGKSVDCAGDMRPGTSVLPRCNPGYKASLVPDYNTIICQDDGEWSDALFKCVAGWGFTCSGSSAFPFHLIHVLFF